MLFRSAAFAANPGVTTPNGEVASVPVRVKAELVNAPTGLTITDETGVALQELEINHGQLAIDNVVGDSVAFKNFRVRRYKSDGTLDPIAATGATAPTLTVALDSNTTNLKKGGVGPATLKSDITLEGAAAGQPSYVVNLTANQEKEHLGKITSIIPNDQFKKATNNGIAAGSYHNSAERTLTVTYKATDRKSVV